MRARLPCGSRQEAEGLGGDRSWGRRQREEPGLGSGRADGWGLSSRSPGPGDLDRMVWGRGLTQEAARPGAGVQRRELSGDGEEESPESLEENWVEGLSELGRRGLGHEL